MGETTENVLLCSSGPCHRASQGVKEEEEKRGTGCVFTADRFRSDKQPHYGGEIESFVVVLPVSPLDQYGTSDWNSGATSARRRSSGCDAQLKRTERWTKLTSGAASGGTCRMTDSQLNFLFLVSLLIVSLSFPAAVVHHLDGCFLLNHRLF